MRRLRTRNINTPEFFDEMWPRWDGGWDPVRLGALTRKIERGDVVVDLGAGAYSAGVWAALYMDEAKDLTLHLVDFSPVALDKARVMLDEAGIAAHYCLADVVMVPLPDGCADVVIAGEIIEHMDDPDGFIREQARICKPGGWMSMSTVNPRCKDSHGCTYPEHVWEFSPGELWEMYLNYGEASYRQLGNYHFVECRKS